VELPLALITLLHVLVLAYWLGGDVGAFYSAGFVIDPKRTVEERRFALGIVNNVDLAPRFSMIAALPTGLALANAKGWLPIGALGVGIAFVLAGVWAWLAWQIHIKHGPAADPFKRVDLAIRWVLVVGLLAMLVVAALNLGPVPLFLGLKCALLATTILLGLKVRAQMADFGPAFVTMITTGPTDDTDAQMARSLGGARPTVMMIWACLILAGLLGFWAPTSYSSFMPS